MQKYTFPADYQPKIEALLEQFQYSLEKPKAIADAVLKLSTHYQENTSITPWSSPEYVAAYAAYFFPLNYVRNLKLWSEAKALQFPHHYSQIVDFGCGLGSALLAGRDISMWNTDATIHTLDHSREPVELLKKYLLPHTVLKTELPKNFKNTLGIFSYSLNELTEIPNWLWDLDHLLIVEPSTSIHARRLMSMRSTLVERGFYLWAPCTHQQNCPLLTESKTDWCHDRIHWEQPEWFQKIEKCLPIKNNTLTTSYILASKTKTNTSYWGRIVGDELIEKGKTRWLFCRTEKREFLSHLSRHGEAPHWKRGQLFKQELNFEQKGQELRLKP